MPMEVVDVVQCHDINQFLQVFLRKEMTAYINHEPTVIILREVFHLSGRQRSQCFALCNGQCLVDGLTAVEYSGLGSSRYRNGIGSDAQVVSLFVCHRRIDFQDDTVLACLTACFDFRPCYLFNIIG